VSDEVEFRNEIESTFLLEMDISSSNHESNIQQFLPAQIRWDLLTLHFSLFLPSKFETEAFTLLLDLKVRDRLASTNDRDIVSILQVDHVSISIHLSRVKTMRLLTESDY
jgi:hypothetical protein